MKYSGNSSITVGEEIDIKNAQTNISKKLDVGDDASFKKNVSIDKDLSVSGDITGDKKATAELHDTRLISGAFITADNKTVTVVDGIIVSIS